MNRCSQQLVLFGVIWQLTGFLFLPESAEQKKTGSKGTRHIRKSARVARENQKRPGKTGGVYITNALMHLYTTLSCVGVPANVSPVATENDGNIDHSESILLHGEQPYSQVHVIQTLLAYLPTRR